MQLASRPAHKAASQGTDEESVSTLLCWGLLLHRYLHSNRCAADTAPKKQRGRASSSARAQGKAAPVVAASTLVVALSVVAEAAGSKRHICVSTASKAKSGDGGDDADERVVAF
mmetsp:Transcript_34674/g.63448  ORF Transcript_34674/g.63448 Transcript_34674/m.63448 type:complete len:114 (-) Transcript_34674:235-576(-)